MKLRLLLVFCLLIVSFGCSLFLFLVPPLELLLPGELARLRTIRHAQQTLSRSTCLASPRDKARPYPLLHVSLGVVDLRLCEDFLAKAGNAGPTVRLYLCVR